MDLNIKIPMPKMHNHFEFKVIDAKSKQVVQEARAENIVLNLLYERLIANVAFYGLGGTNIRVGRGTGALSATRTALFSEITAKLISDFSVITSSPDLLVVSGKITLGESEFVGETITEVGFSTISVNGVTLWNHALLQDSEGNPISIGPKKNTQIIEIYVTVYIERTQGMKPFPNSFNDMLTNTNANASFKLLNSLSIMPSGVSILSSSGAYTAATKTYTLNPVNVATIQANTPPSPYNAQYATTDIIEIQSSIHPSISFPNHDVFEPFTFSERSIGVGDGVNKYFNFDSGFFIQGSEVIKVDGVVQTPGVDYIARQGARQILNNPLTYPYGSKVEPSIYVSNVNKEILNFWKSGLLPTSYFANPYIVIDFNRAVDFKDLILRAIETVTHTIAMSTDGVNWEQIWSGNINGVVKVSLDQIKNARYLWVSLSSTTRGASVFAIPGPPSVSFMTPPANGATVTATWQTEVPPKNVNLFYSTQFAQTGTW